MNPKPINDLKKILQFLHTVERLKTVRRKINISDNSRAESPAEHSWRVALMAFIIHHDQKLDLDLLKALKIILVHDIVEVYADDIWIIDKNNRSEIEKKKERESTAAEKIYSQLPSDLKNELFNLWEEFENHSSKEAKFAFALDKIEVMLQRTDLHAKNWEDINIIDIALHWADESVEEFPELTEIRDLIREELNDQVTSLKTADF